MQAAEAICGRCVRPIDGYHRTSGRSGPNGPIEPETILAVPCGHPITAQQAEALLAEQKADQP